MKINYAPDHSLDDKEAGGVVDYQQEPEVDTQCGYGSCKPGVLQKFNNPKFLLLMMCIFTFSQGFAVNGVNNVNTQTVERRFKLPSSRSGMISSSYDFAAAIFGLFVSFFGSGRFKARWLTFAAVVMGMGSFIMALPHFTTGLYEWGADLTKTCSANATSLKEDVCESSGLQSYLGVLMFGMILHGIGGSTLYTVGVGLIDDSVKATSSPLYLGFLYGTAALGPGLGYIVGGQLLDVWVDFDKVDTSTISLTPSDPRWVGAWWASFFVSFSACMLIAVPLSCYGAELPSAKTIRETRISQMHKRTKKDSQTVTATRLPIKEFPKVIWALIRNQPFLFTTLAGASEGILTSGFATFVPKFIQNHFGVTANTAALYTGAAAVPGAAGGMFFGGFICNKMKLKVRGMLKFSIITCGITILLVTLLWIKCDDVKMAGINHPYKNGSQTDSLADTCNAGCSCTTEFYDPVCDEQGTKYFSSCHAGCAEISEDGKTFSNCTCVEVGSGANVSSVSAANCKSGCGLMYLFIVMFFCVIFTTFLPSTPSDAATLRCIHENHRTFSMGIKWLFIRLLGTVPGPVIFGAVTDTACLVWQTECGEHSSCWIYDNFAVSRNYFLIAISVKVVSIILFSVAFFTYKPPQNEDENEFGVTLHQRESERKNMSFVNGSFRDSEFEANVAKDRVGAKHSDGATNKTTNL